MDAPATAILAGLAGTALGGALGYLLADRASRRSQGQSQTAVAVATQQAAAANAQLQAEQTQTRALRGQLSDCEKQLAAMTAQLEASQKNIAEQKRLLDDANIKLTTAFAAVSMEALEKNNAAFLQMAETRFQTLSTQAAGSLEARKAQIEGLLKPMQELLNQYQQRLGEIEKSRHDSYSALQKQIGQMGEIERTLKEQTGQLISALTRPTVRGQWGEVSLRKLVELAGLTNRCDFLEQASVTSVAEEGGRLRPDMVVQLPANRCIVIDCKAVLGAFLDAAATADESTRKAHLQRHAQLVRARARDLSSKAYWSQFSDTPEFVVLFLPGEAFLYAAAEQDATLIEDCMANRVILATPTTLIALLKTVEYGWRQEAVSRNAEEIRELGIEIYDRLAVLAGHLSKLGGGLDNVVDHYNNAVKSLESRLLVSARKIGELGARNERDMPEVEPVDKRPQELASTLNPAKFSLLPE